MVMIMGMTKGLGDTKYVFCMVVVVVIVMFYMFLLALCDTASYVPLSAALYVSLPAAMSLLCVIAPKGPEFDGSRPVRA